MNSRCTPQIPLTPRKMIRGSVPSTKRGTTAGICDCSSSTPAVVRYPNKLRDRKELLLGECTAYSLDTDDLQVSPSQVIDHPSLRCYNPCPCFALPRPESKLALQSAGGYIATNGSRDALSIGAIVSGFAPERLQRVYLS